MNSGIEKKCKYRNQMNEFVLKERRDRANARERKRMIQLRIAYLKLKEKLPEYKTIKSKKQIVDQVVYLKTKNFF